MSDGRGEKVLIIVMTAVDCVRRGLEGWRMGRVGKREYSGERWEVSREMGGLDQGSKECGLGFPGGAVVKNPPANAGDTGSSPDQG